MKESAELKIAIVSSSFRLEVTQKLEKNCFDTFKKKGIASNQIEVFRVPGSLEIPLAAKKLAQKGVYDAIIAFGVILKGKTYHFEQIANECIRGCMDVSWQYELPVIFEVLAVYDIQNAVARATRTKENKGTEAALTTLEMIKILQKV